MVYSFPSSCKICESSFGEPVCMYQSLSLRQRQWFRFNPLAFAACRLLSLPLFCHIFCCPINKGILLCLQVCLLDCSLLLHLLWWRFDRHASLHVTATNRTTSNWSNETKQNRKPSIYRCYITQLVIKHIHPFITSGLALMRSVCFSIIYNSPFCHSHFEGPSVGVSICPSYLFEMSLCT